MHYEFLYYADTCSVHVYNWWVTDCEGAAVQTSWQCHLHQIDHTSPLSIPQSRAMDKVQPMNASDISATPVNYYYMTMSLMYIYPLRRKT